MARFYGTVKGARGMASRLGHASSGLTVTAQTWGEDFSVRLWAGEDEYHRKAGDRKDMGSVHLGGFCLFHGDTEQFKTDEGIVKWMADLIGRRPSLVAPVIHELATRGLLEESKRKQET